MGWYRFDDNYDGEGELIIEGLGYIKGKFKNSIFASTSTGYMVSDIDVVICVLVFTLFYAILRACYFLYV